MAEIDLELLQNDIRDRLASNPYFVDIPIVRHRDVMLEDITEQQLLETPKAGKYGNGIVIGMPVIKCKYPNIPGPKRHCVIGIRCMEMAALTYNPTTGTLKTAEQMAIAVTADLHQWGDEGKMHMYADIDMMMPTPDLPEGIIGYDCKIEGELPQSVSTQVIIPDISVVTMIVTLTDLTGGSTIYYTTDTTFPGPGNTAAIVYTVPFPVISGTRVRWAAYRPNFRGSDAGQANIT